MEQLFLHQGDRQKEIERLCDNRYPSFAYGALAGLMAQEGGRFNVALTTNFDDLLADALYLFTEARPLVIHHDSLFNHIRPTRTRPLIVKLHGDHQLTPRNTRAETDRLQTELKQQVASLLHDRGLIFVGYGGNDRGIHDLLSALPNEALHSGLFWVSAKPPESPLTSWLEDRKAVWVECANFDHLMILLAKEFRIKHPNKGRFDAVFKSYIETYETLSGSIHALPENAPAAVELKQAAAQASSELPDLWQLRERAQRERNPRKVIHLYHRRLRRANVDWRLVLAFAEYLRGLDDTKATEEQYRLAQESSHNHPDVMRSYARFLLYQRRIPEAKTVIEALPPSERSHVMTHILDARILVAEGHLLQAEAKFKAALEVDDGSTRPLIALAAFFADDLGDEKRAEEAYATLRKENPESRNVRLNQAAFLLSCGRADEGLPILRGLLSSTQALDSPFNELVTRFLFLLHGPTAKAWHELPLIKELVQAGFRTWDWRFHVNLEQARKEKRAEIDWLSVLANVMTGEDQTEALQEWPRWRAA